MWRRRWRGRLGSVGPRYSDSRVQCHLPVNLLARGRKSIGRVVSNPVPEPSAPSGGRGQTASETPNLEQPASGTNVENESRGSPAGDWAGYYRWTSKRPPRELLTRLLGSLEREGHLSATPSAIEIGFGAGNDTLELLRHGWTVLAIDGQPAAADLLRSRVPESDRPRLTILVSPMEDATLPLADLVYASFSLPFCPPERFPGLWTNIRRSVRPGGYFAGQFFGERDEWRSDGRMTFRTEPQVRDLLRGWEIQMLRETLEQGQAYTGPKRWHIFDVIAQKPSD